MNKLVKYIIYGMVFVGCSGSSHVQNSNREERYANVKDSGGVQYSENSPPKKRHNGKKYIADSLRVARNKVIEDSIEKIEDNEEKKEVYELDEAVKHGSTVGG